MEKANLKAPQEANFCQKYKERKKQSELISFEISQKLGEIIPLAKPRYLKPLALLSQRKIQNKPCIGESVLSCQLLTLLPPREETWRLLKLGESIITYF